MTCLDVELAADAGFRREVWERRGKTRLILSWHDFAGTPDAARLEAVLDEMLAAEADVVKLVALAREPADNLRMLSLIPRAQGPRQGRHRLLHGAVGQMVPDRRRRCWGVGSPSPPSASKGPRPRGSSR